jgi:hypothetical protein
MSSPFHRASRVKSNPSDSHFQEKVMYAKARNEPVNGEAQTDGIEYYDQVTLRRDFIGRIDENCAYDRRKLKLGTSSIQTLEIYYSDRGIATVKAAYTLHSTSATL